MSNSSVPSDERRLFEHFVIAGLDESKKLEYLTPSSQECGLRNTQPLAPITDITVIFPQHGETPPEGYEVIESTTLGYPADLNHGSLRIPSCFLCFRRGYHKQPLVDIGILDEGKGDKPMVDTNVVHRTPFGKVANVNNTSQNIFLTYRRAAPNSSQSQFVVTDIKIILANKGEIPPHTYYKIPKKLNKGIVGSEVYICYKKSQGVAKRLAYKPAVLDYFPRKDYSPTMEDFKLAQNVAMFCLPMGAVIECWPKKCQPPDRSFSTFVLTDENGTKFYGSAVTFYEQYNKKLTEEQLEILDLKNDDQKDLEGGTVEDSTSNNDPADDMLFYKNVSICLISRYPFFNSFKRFLFFLHRLSSSKAQSVPIERYISHLMYEVSFPTPRRPRVFMQLGAENISFDSHDDSQLPLNGAQLNDTLKCLGSTNLMNLMVLALMEQKILIHSLRPWMLAAVAESVCALMFPFHWQCPYIPQCPLGLAGVLHAPLPFIAGVDSRYFELYEDPPLDVTCFDLDTSTISYSSVRSTFKMGMLPKKLAKQLEQCLDNVYTKIQKAEADNNAKNKKIEYVPVDQDLMKQRKRREYEIEIHNAFLKFMASLMKGYQSYLRPITCAPATARATDTGNLFDLEGFLRSRDKSSAEFYKRFSETQSFMRFIEERSFVSDKNTYNAFFDDCIAKISALEDGRDTSDLQLLEPDVSHNHTTVFIPAPEPFINPETGEEAQFEYTEFPVRLNTNYFQLDRLEKNGRESEKVPIHFEASRCTAVRTKPETRSSLLAATNAVKTNPLHWAKTLLFYSYSLWFMQLDSLLLAAPNKKKILRLAFDVLHRMARTEIFPLDQVCYRILIELCGKYDEPAMAVKVLQMMQQVGLEQNAVTYGIYHRAVMDATWPTPARQRAIRCWKILQICVNANEAFMKFANIERRRLSIHETQSVSDNGYHSDKVTEKEEKEVEITADYEVTYRSLDDDEDPLGARSINNEKSEREISKVTMSPSRAKFLAEHASMPFSSETTPKSEKNSDGRSNSWFKGIANSPMFKMIRSTTFESPKHGFNDSLDANSSPSLHSLVNQVKRGYDDVVKDVVPTRFRLGVSSLVSEVSKLNKSYGAMGSGMIHSDEKENPFKINSKDPAYILDSGSTGCLLSEEFWMREVYLQLKRSRERKEREETPGTSESSVKEPEGRMEVILSSSTICPSCRTMIYDEEIMSGWKVDDQNLNTVCPHCYTDGVSADAVAEATSTFGVFAPRLTIKTRWMETPIGSWYAPGGLPVSRNSTPEKTKASEYETIQVEFVSPLVLRRELETILTTDKDAMKKESLKDTNPVVFWNLVYYMRRLGLPSQLFSWIAPRHHIRCVFDIPTEHQTVAPLYFLNPNNSNFPIQGKIVPSRNAWIAVTEAVKNNQLFKAIQTLVNESRRVGANGNITVGPHFPIFRDIQFASLDLFGRALVRDSLDIQYDSECQKLPPKIASILPMQDHPLKKVIIAKYEPEKETLKVLKIAGKHLESMGIPGSSGFELYPEEAVFLAENGSAIIQNNQGQELSPFECYSILESARIPMYRYEIYKHVKRTGLVILRPRLQSNRELLSRENTVENVDYNVFSPVKFSHHLPAVPVFSIICHRSNACFMEVSSLSRLNNVLLAFEEASKVNFVSVSGQLINLEQFLVD
ncbi:unnamed protein product [Caenorhabditis bovis]|uniref:Uncharacterized protein n=1 Tax=Caenorhabditis bovis TaxID=2654633 RepID=A0A8S1F130_9PELO|nr:unnamed protein product [Caenorhabditis bovis]